jgi:hypothetical protein
MQRRVAEGRASVEGASSDATDVALPSVSEDAEQAWLREGGRRCDSLSVVALARGGEEPRRRRRA